MNSRSQVRSIQIVYAVMALVPLAFGAVAVALPLEGAPNPDPQFERLLVMVFAGLTGMQLIAAFWIPGKMLEAKKDAPMSERIMAYRAGKMTAGAFCEVPALLWGMLILLSGNLWYGAPLILCVAAMFARFPSVMELETALGKRQQEIDRELVAR